MTQHTIGIIMNGVTGRMGTNQHLSSSILAIREQGGLKCDNGHIIMPKPVLMGRDESKLRALAEKHQVEEWSTELDACLKRKDCQIYFDAQTTSRRIPALRKAIAAGKHIYCEKPIAENIADALAVFKEVQEAGLKNGVVQDKLWLPGLVKLKSLIDSGFFGKIISVKGDFGYWVFNGIEQPAQRPSWNYRAQDGGGIVIDMLCHWRYVIDNLFGNVKAVSCVTATQIDKRKDEEGNIFDCTADDAAYSTFMLENGIICHFNSSWNTRVRKDDLLTLQVDGIRGSAVAGLTGCKIQSAENTPKYVWNPDVASSIDNYASWQDYQAEKKFENAFKIQWELFLKHVVLDAPFRWNLLEGAKGIQLAEKALESNKKRAWVELEKM